MVSHLERKEYHECHVVKRLFNAVLEPVLRMKHFFLIYGIWASLYAGLIPMVRSLDPVYLPLLTALIASLLIYVVSDLPRGWLFSHLFNKAPSKKKKHKISVEQHVQKYGVVETYQMDNGATVLICSQHGIDLWKGFINVIIDAFKQDRSWGGYFSLEHLKVRGKLYKVEMEPTFSGTYDNMLLDLSRLAKLLISYFEDGNQDPIFHVQELYDTMINPPADLISSPSKQPKFLEYLKNHSALKTTRQMKLFIADICQAYRAMGQTEKEKFDNAMGNVVIAGDWRIVALADTDLNRVLTYRAKGGEVKYNTGAHDLFRFLRNFQEHGGDTDATGQQMIQNLQDLEFIAIQKYAKFIDDLIYQLVMELDMAGLLAYGWKTYIE